MRSPSSTSSSSLSSKRSSPLSKSSKSGSETRNPKIQSKNPSFTHIQAKNSTKMKMSAVEAVSHNQLDHLKELVRDSSIELKKTDPQGKTLMSIACENGYENITRFLAENDVSLVSIETPSGYYPVHYCARYNHLDCLKILFDYGASLSPKTNEGKTPLHLAAMWGHVDIVKWLVQQRVNIDIIDNDRMTACDLARKNDQTEIEDFLANCSTGRSSSRLNKYYFWLRIFFFFK
jgi:ankyrin repeat protein